MARAKTHEIKRGDSLIKIAKRNGIKDWKALWTHKENKDLHQQRRGNDRLLQLGDTLVIPADLVAGEDHADSEPKVQVTTGGKTYAMTPKDADATRRQMVEWARREPMRAVRQRVIACRSLWDHFNKINNDQYVVSFLIETTRGAKLPPESIIVQAEQAYKSLEREINGGDLERIKMAFKVVMPIVNGTLKYMGKYRKEMMKGAGAWVSTIEFATGGPMEVLGQVGRALKAGATAVNANARGVVEGGAGIVAALKKGPSLALPSSLEKAAAEPRWDTVVKTLTSAGAGSLLAGKFGARIITGVATEIVSGAPSWVLRKVIIGQQKRIDFVKKIIQNHHLPALRKAMDTAMKVMNIMARPTDFIKEVANKIMSGGFLNELDQAIIKLLPKRIVKELPKKEYEEHFKGKKDGRTLPQVKAINWVAKFIRKNPDLLTDPFHKIITAMSGKESPSQVVELLARNAGKTMGRRLYKAADLAFGR